MRSLDNTYDCTVVFSPILRQFSLTYSLFDYKLLQGGFRQLSNLSYSNLLRVIYKDIKRGPTLNRHK